MPIPQVERKRTHHSEHHTRDATTVRKQRAQRRGHGDHRAPSRPRNWFAALRWYCSRERIKKTLVTIVLACVGSVMLIVGAAYLWVSQDLADIEDVEKRLVDQSTRIYARDGETLLYEIGDNRRQDVALDQITPEVAWATLALEDQKFYKHKGFSITSIVRAVFRGVFGGQASATSTLTQQFVKNAILTSERTYTRKLKELILAVRLEQKYSKDEILNMYLNEVYYGANFQGIEASAQGYYGKHASELTLAESATLASLPKNPVIYPRDPERLKARRDYALDQMASLDTITKEEAEQAKQEDTTISEAITGINAPHFVFYVREYLEKKYGQNNVRRGGMKVVTTLDWDKQQKAEQAINDGIPKIEQYGGSNAALVSIDTKTGQILAMVGSRDWFDTEHDGQVNVVTSLRQPGSSFKPVVYLTAFTKGYTPETKVFDIETDFPTEAEGKYHPRNYSLNEHGPIALRNALAQSLNIPAVKVLYLAGVNEALNVAEQLGYSSFADRSRFGLSLVLGGGEVTLLDHTSAYATYAREGEYHAPAAILRIEDREGKTIEEWQDVMRQAVDANAVRTLNSVLSDSGARSGSFSILNLKDRPSAGKTGTTNDFRDAWSMGYTPSIATGVWTGNNDNSEMVRGADGSIIAAPIWNKYMNSVLEGTTVETFKGPNYKAKTEVLGGKLEEIKTVAVDSVTGEVVPEECVDDYPEQYVVQKEFKEIHEILHYLSKENPAGPPPENPRQDPMYEPWETAVVRWATADERKNEYLTDQTPRADCNQRNKNQQPTVSLLAPTDNETVLRREFFIQAEATPGKNRTITSVQFTIDTTIVETINELASTTTSTLTSSYNPATLTAGVHTVTVRVTDDKGNFAEAAAEVLVELKKEVTTIDDVLLDIADVDVEDIE